MDEKRPSIQRHRTAIKRRDLSLPIKCALRDNLIDPAASLFDYGCGYGRDIELLNAKGFKASGWDPAYFPDNARDESDIVNIGYVINVIEDPGERAATLRKAWDLCRRLLIVSAQVLVPGRGQSQIEFGDGILTGRGTFQKYFGQVELKSFLEAELQAEAIPAEIGVYYIFKDQTAGQHYQASRYRRRVAALRERLCEVQFEENRELLESLMTIIRNLGRLPETDELPNATEIINRFGSLTRAFTLIRRVTGTDAWQAIEQRCTEDLLVYLALGRFNRRPPISVLPLSLQRDIRTFFGSYTNACRQADALLFKAGDPDAIDAACGQSSIGKCLPNALYIHRTALESLEPLLRIYEGCARAYLGEIEGANLIKLHRQSGKVSYLTYPGFETDPHPALARSVKLSLRTLKIESYDYALSPNPPILHRKDTFLQTDHPLYEKFARLSRQEENYGLLEETSTIGTRDGWESRLRERGFKLKGHRIVRMTTP
jgi:DNA phosphorothioation-associated putative methyltransferase